MKKKIAFTLAELMITLTVIGILAAILIPLAAEMKPNRNKVMAKKAYYILQKTVSEMINDDILDPKNDTNPGFKNTVAVTANGISFPEGNSKFCKIFASKVNTVEDL